MIPASISFTHLSLEGGVKDMTGVISRLKSSFEDLLKDKKTLVKKLHRNVLFYF